MTGEVVHQRPRLPVLQHASDLGLEVFSQRLASGQAEQLVVRHAAPEKIGQARGQREFIHWMNRAGIVRLRLQLAAEQEIRRHQRRFQCHLEALLEALAIRVGQREQFEQPVHLLLQHGAPEGAGGEPADDLPGGFHLGLRRRMPEENALVRFGQHHGPRRVGVLDFEIVDDEIAIAVLRVRVVGIAIIVQIRRREFVRAGRHLRAKFVNLRRRFLRLHVELGQFLVVQAEGHPRRLRPGLFAVGFGPQNIFAVVRKLYRSKNVPLATQPLDPLAQRLAGRRALERVGVEMLHRPRLQVGDDRLVQNLPGGSQIFLQQHRWQREDVADVVETVTGIIRRKIIRRLEIDADQVPDRIVVFGAIQTPDRDPARVGMVAVTLKNFGLNPDGDEFAFLGCRLGLFLGRHLMGLKILDDLREDFAVAQHHCLVRVNAQIQVPLLLFTVAAVTILAQQRFDRGLKRRVAAGPGPFGRFGACGRLQDGEDR